MLRAARGQRGDTLVEVIMALAILSVVLVTAYNIANLNYRVGLQARERTEATHLAQGAAERLRAMRDAYSRDVPGASNVTSSTVYAACSQTSPCRLQQNGATWRLVSGVEQVGFYSMAIWAAEQNMGASGAQPVNYTIRVGWDSIVSNVQNETIVNLLLTNTKGIRPCESTPAAGGCI